MTPKVVVLASISVLLTSACSTLKDRQTANGGFDYMEASEQEVYQVPEDLDAPEIKPDWRIPRIGENAPKNAVGKNVTVVSPVLVLPIVTGSHIEEGLKEATVWFDQVDDSQPLDTTIWNSLLSFLEEQGIGVVSFDKEAQTLVTDWMIVEKTAEDSRWYEWTTTERSIGKRFEFKLDMKPHGRTGALKVELRDYLETVGDDVVADLDAEAERRNEVAVLNQVISHYDSQIRIEGAKRVRQIREGFETEMGFNNKGEPALVVAGEYDLVWPRLLLVLRKLGFDVKDLDKSTGLMFVNYGSLDLGWWDSLWSDDGDKLELEKDAYRINVAKSGERTSVTLLSEDNESFTADQISKIYQTFARTMAEKDLDI